MIPTEYVAGDSRPRLLLVDDQAINIRMLHQIFQADYDVFSATSGEQALAFCEGRQPDLILLDIVMPGMDGYEVCRRLKSNPLTAAIPVIFVTAHSESSEEEMGLAVGAVDFISKSASVNVVKARVKTHLTLKYQADLLRAHALIDGLTGVANRRYFDEVLAAEWRRCVRSALPLSLILIDIDFFKRFNDHYGHQAGDACLQQVALCIKATLSRSHDLLARYGGEEFACILPETALEGAEQKAQAMQAAVRALAIPHATSDVAGGVVTISLGVVAVRTAKHEDDATDLIGAADSLLYEAKHAGRAQVKAKCL